jgi:hypothetical protein
MRKSRAAKKRQSKNVAIGVLALVFFLSALGGVAYYLSTRNSGLDQDTLCPRTGPIGHIVLLVDKTDPLNFNQKQAFLRLLEELIDRRVAAGYLVSVFVLGEDYREGAKALVEICNPGTGEGKSELTANITKLNAQFRERFREPLLQHAETMVATTAAKSSPIIEMLQLVSINGFRKHAVKGPRRLIIVSDMLHNTAELSMYKGIPDFDAFAASDYARKMRTELDGVDVELHEVLHSPKLQTRRLLEFWESFFSKSGARVVIVRPMEG